MSALGIVTIYGVASLIGMVLVIAFMRGATQSSRAEASNDHADELDTALQGDVGHGPAD